MREFPVLLGMQIFTWGKKGGLTICIQLFWHNYSEKESESKTDRQLYWREKCDRVNYSVAWFEALVAYTCQHCRYKLHLPSFPHLRSFHLLCSLLFLSIVFFFLLLLSFFPVDLDRLCLFFLLFLSFLHLFHAPDLRYLHHPERAVVITQEFDIASTLAICSLTCQGSKIVALENCRWLTRDVKALITEPTRQVCYSHSTESRYRYLLDRAELQKV